MKNDSVSSVSTADISFEVGYKEDKTRFDMRMISVSEEAEFQQKFNDLADDDASKAEKEYQICLSVLVDYSHSSIDGEKLRDKFQAMNVKNERVVRGAFNAFRNSLAPDLNFL